MNKTICIIVILLVALSHPKINYAQNLVQNPSFEAHNNCDVGPFTWQASGSYGIFPDEPTANKWYRTGPGTSDYFVTCATDWHTMVPTNLLGTQTPHTGDAYGGMIPYGEASDTTYREYLMNHLLQPLVAGHQYIVSFWLSRADETYIITNATAIHFSNTPYVNTPNYSIFASSDISSPTMISSHDWTKIEGVYTATGGEEWLTIGNFQNPNQVQIQYPPNAGTIAYYYIDDVSVTEIQQSVNDTLYLCSGSGTLHASGSTAFSPTLLNGNATITGNGPNFTVTATTPSTILLHSTNNIGAPISDTFLVIPAPNVDAGVAQTLSGCNNYSGTLNGSISNTTAWVNYAIAWTPAAGVVAGGNTLTPAIAPTQNTNYKLTVSTDNMHGNCAITDSIMVTVHDLTTISNFSFVIKKGCEADTVIFTNLSQNAHQYSWDFGDGSALDTAQNPIHIYHTQGLYAITLTSLNGGCTSNIIKNIDTKHPLKAIYNSDKDIICQGNAVTFTNSSIVTALPATYQWFFGDGTQANSTNTTHTFHNSGTFNTMLVAGDAIPCFDTVYHTITVDSATPVILNVSRRDICTGESIMFNANTANQGNPQFIWDFGDSNILQSSNIVTHSYDSAGLFKTNLTVTFRACPDITLNDSVVVHSFPIVNLGPDTALCLDGKTIHITNLEPAQPGDRFEWNNGTTTASTLIKHPGIYKLTVTNTAGCSTTDEVDVKKDCYIDIPNSFTPNNDGVNDYFFPRQELSQGVAGFTMQVFDRWGAKIFETTMANGRGWDGKFNGKDQPEGVYIYIINVVLKNGRTEHYTGNVTLLK